MASKLLFRQLFEAKSFTYTYLLGCTKTRQALIIDPVIETVERDASLVHELGLDLKYVINTHIHADHVTGSGELKRNKYFPKAISILSGKASGRADLLVKHSDLIRWGDGLELEVRETPGHTNGCVTFVCHSNQMAFTGDALLIRGCGRTDFQHGNARTLFQSVNSQIFTLPPDYLIYPAHDYAGRMVSSVWEEKKFNPRLTKSEEEFAAIMENLGLPYPKQIEKSEPANLLCGISELMDDALRRKVFGEKKQ
ncbi:hypothetical protein niasHT_035151 [Heterodera trifolii]|uniref:Persulfide dioxygenase ETHE1, mitochondrial n=1 Tax=Heterodera trifolii TaxID=157864 RepID=A0ABD2J303_9BILA